MFFIFSPCEFLFVCFYVFVFLVFLFDLTFLFFLFKIISAKQFREALSKKYEMDCGLAMIVKQRAKANEIERMDLVGSVDGCDAIIGEKLIFFVKKKKSFFSYFFLKSKCCVCFDLNLVH